MFKNSFYIAIKKQIVPYIYSIYILKSFAKDFLIWLVVFFAILFAMKHLDGYDGFTLKQNLIIDCYRAGSVLCDNINIIILISCIFFIIRMKNSFNFQILETFGLSSMRILSSIIFFLIFTSLIKTFLLRPIIVNLENQKTIILNKNINIQDNIILKSGIKFNIINSDNKNDFIIISGKYNEHDKNYMSTSDTVFLKYENKNLVKSYVAQSAILQNNKWFLKNVNILNLINKYSKIEFKDSYEIDSNLTPKEMAVKIKNTEKLSQSLQLGLYDHIKLIKQKHKTDINIQNEIDAKARIYITNEIVSLFLYIACCLLSFLFCVSNSRNSNIAKLSLKCFIVYFIILRLFHSLENIIKISNYGAYCVILLSIIICYFIYFFIINKDWCNIYTKQLSTTISTIKHIMPSFKTIKKGSCFMKS